MRVLAFTLLLCSLNVFGQDLHSVRRVFIAGNNQPAEQARAELQKGKHCLSLALKQSDADGVLDVKADSQSSGGKFGEFGSREWIASGTLTLKTGELVWSGSERFCDAPFRSGGKVAGKLLIHKLEKEIGCKR